MSIVAATATRVPWNTAPDVDRRIRKATHARIKWLCSQGPAAIGERLQALDKKWDIECRLETYERTSLQALQANS
jgi:hypothetical protein